MVRRRPLLRPIVVSSITGAPPRNLPPTRPPVARYAHVFSRLINLMTGLAMAISVFVYGRGTAMALDLAPPARPPQPAVPGIFHHRVHRDHRGSRSGGVRRAMADARLQ